MPGHANLALCLLFACTHVLSAQRPSGLDLGSNYAAGGEAERYLRAAELTGAARATAWTIRPLWSRPRTNGDWLSEHPWSSRFSNDTVPARLSLRLLRPDARLIFNSSFPTTGDGPVWAGRGITGALQAGFAARLGPLQLQFAPVLFLAQNQSFTLAVNGENGRGALRDARFPETIDAPQRFGTGTYGRFDGGASTLSIAVPGISAGISTAAESWGPAREFPLVLGGNSGGFAHAFLGTRNPIDLKLFSLHTRLIAGTLQQSHESPIDTGSGKRWASALVITLVPHGIDGLEVGLTRFVEAELAGGFPDLAKVNRVFSGANINQYQNAEDENQIASAFFRWAFPKGGFELYGEYAREDYSLDVRRLLQYPDDLRSYVLGIQRGVQEGSRRLRAFGFELVNAELSSSNRGERGDLAERKLRQPYPPYLHGVERQGHTNNGLFLGSPEAYGGAAWRAVMNQFTPAGRTSVAFERSLRLDWLPGTAVIPDATHPDVVWALGFERMRFSGKRDYTFSFTGMLDANRNLVHNNNVFNVRAALTVRGWGK